MMYYDRSEFEYSTGEFNSEESLEFFKWNESSLGVVTSVDDNNPETNLPSDFVVNQNYPNPFNPSTTISYSIPVKADVSIIVFNVLGQNVRQFSKGTQSAGSHSMDWDSKDDNGKRVASGIYFYRVIANDKVIS